MLGYIIKVGLYYNGGLTNRFWGGFMFRGGLIHVLMKLILL